MYPRGWQYYRILWAVTTTRERYQSWCFFAESG